MTNTDPLADPNDASDRLVATSRTGSVAVLLLNNPPVNALSARLRASLHEALAAARDNEDVSGIVIACAGRTFVAGADIGEFGTARQLQPPLLPDLCNLIESMRKPTAAAIHGTALGGGLELALACRYRVVDADARLGLPEVKLGLMPGSGGTVRLPRLIGPENALEMIVSGTPVGAAEALANGLADSVSDGDVIADSVAFMRARIDDGTAFVPLRDRTDRLASTRAEPAPFEALAARLIGKTRGLNAPAACAEAVRRAVHLPFDEAIAREREAFLGLVSSSESRSLRHLYFAERRAAKVPGVAKDIASRQIGRIGVIGAGTMGGGIAMAFANAGLPVTLLDMNQGALTRGVDKIDRNYAGSVSRGSLSEQERETRMSLLTTTMDYGDLGTCDLIVEAAFEDMGVKKDVFSRLAKVSKPGAILATNTSYLDVNEIALSSDRPQDVVGLHFFSPANVMKLLEVVRAGRTAADVIATTMTLARRIGKVPVVVGVCHGFVGNRMLAARSAENENLLMEGASPAQIDKVFRDFGWPMGPFQMADLAGLDIGWRNRKALGKAAAIADALCEQGRFGQKTGLGYYRYEEGSRTPRVDPAVAELIEAEAARRDIVRREVGASEIIERTLYPMINEGAKILNERVAARASDIDLVWVHGYGFPSAKGGPMYWAEETVGLQALNERLSFWHGLTGNPLFAPAEPAWVEKAHNQRLIPKI